MYTGYRKAGLVALAGLFLTVPTIAGTLFLFMGCASTHTLLDEGPMRPEVFTIRADANTVNQSATEVFKRYHFIVIPDGNKLGFVTSAQPFNRDGKSSAVRMLAKGAYHIKFISSFKSMNDSTTAFSIFGVLSYFSSGLWSASANEQSVQVGGPGYSLMKELVDSTRFAAENRWKKHRSVDSHNQSISH